MAFVFGTLVEFALVLFLNQTIQGKENASISADGFKKENGNQRKVFVINGGDEKKTPIQMKIKTLNLSNLRLNRNSLNDASKKKEFIRQLGPTKKIDLISFVIFNLGYFIFNVIYWTSYAE